MDATKRILHDTRDPKGTKFLFLLLSLTPCRSFDHGKVCGAQGALRNHIPGSLVRFQTSTVEDRCCAEDHSFLSIVRIKMNKKGGCSNCSFFFV